MYPHPYDHFFYDEKKRKKCSPKQLYHHQQIGGSSAVARESNKGGTAMRKASVSSAPRDPDATGCSASEQLVAFFSMLRLTLMLPVTIGPNGAVGFRWWSRPAAATALAWLALLATSWALIVQRLGPVTVWAGGRRFHFWDLVPRYAAALTTSYVVFMPYTCWAVAPKGVALLRRWRRVEAQMAAHGCVAAGPGLRRYGRALRGLVVAVSLFALLLQSIVLLSDVPGEHVWLVPPVTHSAAFVVLASCFWVFCCRALGEAAHSQAARIPSHAKGLRAHCRLWRGLRRVLSLLAAFGGRTQTLLLGMLFVSLVSLGFLLMQLALTGRLRRDPRGLLLAVPLLVFAVAFVAICSATQGAVDAMRQAATKQLLWMSLSVRDGRELSEIVRFLRYIHLESPRVTVCGLGTLGRPTIISLVALAQTYLVVLSQFTISLERSHSHTNFSEDPSFQDFDDF